MIDATFDRRGGIWQQRCDGRFIDGIEVHEDGTVTLELSNGKHVHGTVVNRQFTVDGKPVPQQVRLGSAQFSFSGGPPIALEPAWEPGDRLTYGDADTEEALPTTVTSFEVELPVKG